MEFYQELLERLTPEDEPSLEEVFESICSLLSYMFDAGVPITASNSYNKTILGDFCAFVLVSKLPRLYNLISTLDTSLCVDSIAHTNIWSNLADVDSISGTLKTWGVYPEIAEAFGFNDIFCAVMQQDRQKLEAVPMDDQLPQGILETDMYGRNILHASITWPEGLGLLLQHKQAVSLLCDNDLMMFSPLQIAIGLSGTVCTEPDKWVLCRNCHCATSAQVLLEADCSLPVHLMSPGLLEDCSLRCRKLLFKHLENRRGRLRDLSLALLPSEITDRYGLVVGSLPDATAWLLWEELQIFSRKLTSEEFDISPGLKPFRSGRYSGGLFEQPLPLEICSLANEFGFQPLDEGGLPPFLARVRGVFDSNMYIHSDIYLPFLDWLLKHDLKLEYLASGFQTSVFHDLGGIMGRYHHHFFPREDPTDDESGKGLITKVCNSEMQSNLPCPCVSGAYNRPLASLISGFANSVANNHFGILDTTSSMRYFAARIEKLVSSVDKAYLARCAIHTMTMKLLDIRHIGPCPRNSLLWETKEPTDEDEWVELLDEDRLLLERLNDLDEDLEREFQCRNETVADFIGGYYAEKMLEVLNQMYDSPTSDYRHGLLDAGVVLGDPEESSYAFRLYRVTESEDLYDDGSDSGE
ncbi:uncharacterized protein FPRN_13968 [Fusarium proliferatum]|nr:uncharacterized protein FPRN_13968 [Fusarium proliferatum]